VIRYSDIFIVAAIIVAGVFLGTIFSGVGNCCDLSSLN